uniref:Uncharacterized protein n=1 Tax=Gorilla gorilla gorilla TaxID=9595 RepID=A0A2I2YQB8_GORGO
MLTLSYPFCAKMDSIGKMIPQLLILWLYIALETLKHQTELNTYLKFRLGNIGEEASKRGKHLLSGRIFSILWISLIFFYHPEGWWELSFCYILEVIQDF